MRKSAAIVPNPADNTAWTARRMDRTGYVYIMSNSSFAPDLLKIGMTTRSARHRAWELYQEATGVPGRFSVELEVEASDCMLAESLVHHRLRDYRYNSHREFFLLPLGFAIDVVHAVCDEVNRRPPPPTKSTRRATKNRSSTLISSSIPEPALVQTTSGFHTRRCILRCPQCGTTFQITFRRYEGYTFCPSCAAMVVASITW